MANINELRAQRHSLKQRGMVLVNSALTSGVDLRGAESAEYDTIIASLERVNASIDEHEAGAHMGGGSPLVTPRGGSPLAMHGGATSVLTGDFRAAYASANSEQRGQIDAIAAYLGGREISAAANLRPNSDGAFIIPSFVVPALERAYTEFAPVVSVARLWPTETGAAMTFPVLSDSESAVQLDAAAVTGADATVSGDTPPTTLTGPTLHAWKASSKPVFIPRETFTDSPVDIVEEVVGALLARIIRWENLKYTRGAGTTEPEGFLLNATKLVTGAVALDLDICLDLAYNVPALYRGSGVYMMSDTTAKYLRKLKTGISGDKQMLWADADATKGTPSTLHGYPVVINNDMDSVLPDGTFAGSNPVAFGDFKKLVVRQAEQNQPFAYRYAVPARDGGAVILFRRSDSKLIVPAAISKVAVS